MKVRGGQFYPVGDVLTKRQEMQAVEVLSSIRNWGLADVVRFADRVQGYTEGENAAILTKKKPAVLKELRDTIAAIRRLQSAMNR